MDVTESSHGPILSRLGAYDPTIDPSSPSFDPIKWSNAVVNLRSRLGIPMPPRSGFVFRGLTVRGNGPAFEQRDTVWSSISSVFRCSGRFRTEKTKPILHSLDGIVHQGELLLVLGRPGSGCTTFLRTITGEMRGLELSPESVIQYRGKYCCSRNERLRERGHNLIINRHPTQDYGQAVHGGDDLQPGG